MTAVLGLALKTADYSFFRDCCQSTRLRPGCAGSSSQRVQVYRLPEDDLNSVRDCFGHQLAEMIEKLTVRPKDFVYLDRVIKAFGRDGPLLKNKDVLPVDCAIMSSVARI